MKVVRQASGCGTFFSRCSCTNLVPTPGTKGNNTQYKYESRDNRDPTLQGPGRREGKQLITIDGMVQGLQST